MIRARVEDDRESLPAWQENSTCLGVGGAAELVVPVCDYGPIYESIRRTATATRRQPISETAHSLPPRSGRRLFSERGPIRRELATQTGLHSYYTDQTDVQSGVRDYGAMMVELEFVNGDGFGPYTTQAGEHDAVIDGFTLEGPLVVSWARRCR